MAVPPAQDSLSGCTDPTVAQGWWKQQRQQASRPLETSWSPKLWLSLPPNHITASSIMGWTASPSNSYSWTLTLWGSHVTASVDRNWRCPEEWALTQHGQRDPDKVNTTERPQRKPSPEENFRSATLHSLTWVFYFRTVKKWLRA